MADVADTSAGEKLHCCAFKYMVILSWPLHQNPNKVYLCFCPKKTFLNPFHQPLQSSWDIWVLFTVWGWTVTSSQTLSVTLSVTQSSWVHVCDGQEEMRPGRKDCWMKRSQVLGLRWLKTYQPSLCHCSGRLYVEELPQSLCHTWGKDWEKFM